MMSKGPGRKESEGKGREGKQEDHINRVKCDGCLGSCVLGEGIRP